MDATNETAATIDDSSRHASHRTAMRRFLEAAWGGAEATHSASHQPVSPRRVSPLPAPS